MNTILNIFKPSGKRSFEIVEFLREKLRERKIGYAGILDAPAEGVLVVGVGTATKLLDLFVELPKEYEAEVLLGIRTDTGDISGTVVEKQPPPDISEKDIKLCLNKFQGEITQIPPMYSAQKIDGTPLHKLARKGITIRRKPKKVTIYAIELMEFRKDSKRASFRIKVSCSKGTYMRVLAEDIATALSSVGTLLNLRRTAVGPFRIENSIKLEEINERDIPSLEDSLEVLTGLRLSSEEFSCLRRYGFVPNKLKKEEPLVRILDQFGQLKGIGKLNREILTVKKWLTLQR